MVHDVLAASLGVAELGEHVAPAELVTRFDLRAVEATGTGAGRRWSDLQRSWA